MSIASEPISAAMYVCVSECAAVCMFLIVFVRLESDGPRKVEIVIFSCDWRHIKRRYIRFRFTFSFEKSWLLNLAAIWQKIKLVRILLLQSEREDVSVHFCLLTEIALTGRERQDRKLGGTVGGWRRQHCVQEWNSEGSISPSTYLYRFEVSEEKDTVSVDSNRVNVFWKCTVL